MKRLLLMEGNTLARRDAAAAQGIQSSSAVYTAAIHAHFPAIDIDVINAADDDAEIPSNAKLQTFDGFVITGSSLHAYDDDFGVTNQIATLTAAADAGLPILGSCWGLQIACVAAGGQVGLSPKGREVGFARKIVPTLAGHAHPLLRNKGAVYDAPCIHYDEVTQLPVGATLLATNAHSAVQAAVIPLRNSEIWAIQYHPEFDMRSLADLYRLYSKDMLAQGFFTNETELQSYAAKLAALDQNPEDAALAWQLGIDTDITNDERRRAEIIAWIEHKILS